MHDASCMRRGESFGDLGGDEDGQLWCQALVQLESIGEVHAWEQFGDEVGPAAGEFALMEQLEDMWIMDARGRFDFSGETSLEHVVFEVLETEHFGGETGFYSATCLHVFDDEKMPHASGRDVLHDAISLIEKRTDENVRREMQHVFGWYRWVVVMSTATENENEPRANSLRVRTSLSTWNGTLVDRQLGGRFANHAMQMRTNASGYCFGVILKRSGDEKCAIEWERRRAKP